jgi:hypothetical protein
MHTLSKDVRTKSIKEGIAQFKAIINASGNTSLVGVFMLTLEYVMPTLRLVMTSLKSIMPN